jgi:hypothetical protein
VHTPTLTGARVKVARTLAAIRAVDLATSTIEDIGQTPLF